MERLELDITTQINSEIKEKPIFLKQSDFEKGTYIIKESGHYLLEEDIFFNPNCPSLIIKNKILDDNQENNNEELDWLPTETQKKHEYSHSSFVLGFYSAINIEVDNVIIDLNGFSISQHPLHALQQRFFQVIQLNNSPFIHKQGPSKTFSDSGFKSCKNVIIKNGRLGLSSHYSIHGNDNQRIVLKNLLLEDFEAGGIALNNVDSLILDNVKIQNSRRDVPVFGNYSVLRNMKISYNKCSKDVLDNISFHNENGTNIFKKILKIERRIIQNYIMSQFKSILNVNKDDEIEEEIEKYFYNKHGIPDGSVLTGIQITPRGVAIHAFQKVDNSNTNPCCHSQLSNGKNIEKYSSDIFINEVSIRNLIVKPIEIIHAQYNGNNITGIFGDVINLLNVMDKEGYYISSSLNDCLCCMSKMVREKKVNLISTINVPEWMEEWSESKKQFKEYKKNIKIMYGKDIMAHTMKGCIGLRLDGTKNINIENIKINNIYNFGKDTLQNLTFPKQDKVSAVTNIQQETGIKYAGTFSIGIILSVCSNIIGNNININSIISRKKNNFEILYNNSEKINDL